MEIDNLSFEDKVNLLKDLLDDLNITLTAHYGAEGYVSSNNITVHDNEEIKIWTGICTG